MGSEMRFVSKAKLGERGSVLIVSLIFLLLLTIIGVGAMQSATLQERMAGSTKDSNTAFQAAEAALRSAEEYLSGATIGPFNGSAGLYVQCTGGKTGTECTIPVWSDRSSKGWVKRSGTLAGVSAQPEYIIQQMTTADPSQDEVVGDTVNLGSGLPFYRVIARGYGTSDNTMVVLQIMFNRNE